MGRKRKRPDSPTEEQGNVKPDPVPVTPEPPVKRRRSVDPALLFHEVYETIRYWKDETGRLLCEHLVRVPKRRNVPEYYEKVENPIDLLKIQQRLKTDEYTTLETFMSDMQLLLANAHLFYARSSPEYTDTTALREILWSTCQRLFPDCGPPPPGPQLAAQASSSTVSSKSTTTPVKAASAMRTASKPAAAPPSTRSTRASAIASTSPPASSAMETATAPVTPLAAPGAAQTDRLSSLSSSASLLEVCQAVMDDVLSLEHSGRSVCDIFMNLPSRSDYPEYYRVITEPMDIKIILQNIKAKHYTSFAEFRLDLTIMVKNAQHFNEPSSQVHKDATLIGKTVESLVKRLTSSHPSMMLPRPSLKVVIRPSSSSVSPLPSSTTAGAKATPTASPAATFSPAVTAVTSNESSNQSAQPSLPASLVVRDDELASSPGSSDGDEGGAEKTDSWSRVPQARRYLVNFFTSVLKTTGSSGQELCKDFMRLPSSLRHPAYYAAIKNPMSLARIKRRLWMNHYKCLEEMRADMELSLRNAMLYHLHPSKTYNDASALLEVMERIHDEFKEQHEPSLHVREEGGLRLTIRRSDSGGHTASPVAKPPQQSSVASSTIEPVAQPDTHSATHGCHANMTVAQRMTILHDAITNEKDQSGQQKCLLLTHLPSIEGCSSYYKTVNNPIDLDTIQKKMLSGKYQTMVEVCKDYHLLFSNTKAFYGDSSYLYDVASHLEDILWKTVMVEKAAVQTMVAASPIMTKASSSSSVASRSADSALRWQAHKANDHLLKVADVFQCPRAVRDGFNLYLLEGKYCVGASDLAAYSGLTSPLDVFKLYPNLTRMLVTDSQEKKLLSAQGLRECDGHAIVLLPSQVEAIIVNTARYKDKKTSSSGSVQRPFPATTAQSSAANSSASFQSPSPGVVSPSSQVFLHRRPGRPIGTVKPRTATAAELDLANQQSLLEGVSQHSDVSGRVLITPFMDLPSAEEYPDYYAVIKNPIDMKSIRSNMEQFKYSDMEELYRDLMLMLDNATKYNEPGSQIYKDSMGLQNYLGRKKSVLKDRAGKSRGSAYGTYPDVALLVRQLLAKLFQAVLNYEDTQGRCLSVQLFQAASVQAAAEQKVMFKPINLEAVKRAMNEGDYQRLDKLQADVFNVLEEVRKHHAVHSQEWQDSVALQQFFIEKRDELCGQGQILDSPAFSFGLPNLEARLVKVAADLAAAKAMAGPAVGQACADGGAANATASTDSALSSVSTESVTATGDEKTADGEVRMEVSGCEVEQELAAAGEPEAMDETLDGKDDHLGKEGSSSIPAPKASITVGSEKYQRGDFVYAKPRDELMDNHIVAIERWDGTGEEVEFYGNYFYRPPETFHVPTRKFLEKEVFKSDYFAPFPASNLIGRCCVLNVKEYFKMAPEGVGEEDVFVCESRYMTKAKSFKKIKVWPFGSGNCKLKMRALPLAARRVESVFATHADTAGSSAAKMAAETDSALSVSGGAGVESGMRAAVTDSHVDANAYTVSQSVNVKKAESQEAIEDGCTYYEQYCFESGTFKLGDNVYLRSDQAEPFVARIDRIWTDKQGHPYFHGPWFVRPSEVEHPASRMFYKHELLMSSIHDTNPMRSIQGRCCILDMQTYVKGRVTDIAESDVFVCESRYNEADKQIRRLKGLKIFQLSSKTVSDEWYYFGEDIAPLKVPSPQLVVDELDGSAMSTQASSSLASSSSSSATHTAALPASASSTNLGVAAAATAAAAATPPRSASTAVTSVAQPSLTGSVAGYLLFAGEKSSELQRSLPGATLEAVSRQVEKAWHKLSAAQRSAYDARASALSHSSVFASPQPNIPVYECSWEGCLYQFDDEQDLVAHLLNTNVGGHLHNPGGNIGEFPCKWTPCQRYKRHMPFQSHYKLSKHVRETHQHHGRRLISVTQLSANYFPKSVAASAVASAVARVGSNASPSGSVSNAAVPAFPSATTQLPATVPSTPVAASSSATTTTAVVPASSASVDSQTARAATTAAASTVERMTTIVDDEARSRAVHSAIYSKYVSRIQGQSLTLSDWSEVTNTDTLPAGTPLVQLPVAWLPQQAVNQSTAQHSQQSVITKSLLDLRKLLLRDAASLSSWSSTLS